jgi:hypothetical protein
MRICFAYFFWVFRVSGLSNRLIVLLNPARIHRAWREKEIVSCFKTIFMEYRNILRVVSIHTIIKFGPRSSRNATQKQKVVNFVTCWDFFNTSNWLYLCCYEMKFIADFAIDLMIVINAFVSWELLIYRQTLATDVLCEHHFFSGTGLIRSFRH